MIRKNKFHVFDDLKKIDELKSLKDVYDKYSDNMSSYYALAAAVYKYGFYSKENFHVVKMTDRRAVCAYYGHMVEYLSLRNPDMFKMERVLKNALREITNMEI